MTKTHHSRIKQSILNENRHAESIATMSKKCVLTSSLIGTIVCFPHFKLRHVKLMIMCQKCPYFDIVPKTDIWRQLANVIPKNLFEHLVEQRKIHLLSKKNSWKTQSQKKLQSKWKIEILPYFRRKSYVLTIFRKLYLKFDNRFGISVIFYTR